MEVYIVTNEGSRYYSDYRDIIGVFNTLEKAIICMKACADDFINLCDQGEGFDNYTVKSTSDPYSLMISDDDYPIDYEVWYIDIYKVE